MNIAPCEIKQSSPIANEFADKGVGLNSAALTDDDTSLNLDERSNKRAITDRAAVKINRLDNDDVRSELNVPNSSRPQGATSHPATTSSPSG